MLALDAATPIAGVGVETNLEALQMHEVPQRCGRLPTWQDQTEVHVVHSQFISRK